MRRFNKQSRDFDREFSRMKKWGVIMGIGGITLSLALMGFVIWVIVQLLRFFGVI